MSLGTTATEIVPINLSDLIKQIQEHLEWHPRVCNEYNELADSLEDRLKNIPRKDNLLFQVEIGDIGVVNIAYRAMGAINTLHLFGIDELILFAFYCKNRFRYRNVADIGANIGLHSVVLAKLGYAVQSFEPDEKHLNWFRDTIAKNNVSVNLNECAVSKSDGYADFVRVLGNTTSSHLKGSKGSPYGQVETFQVPTRAFGRIMLESDLIKMDVEGHEKVLIEATTPEMWAKTDLILEIGTSENAKDIYNHLCKMNINMFTQKNGWRRASTLNDVPVSYKEGSAFCSIRSEMPWQ